MKMKYPNLAKTAILYIWFGLSVLAPNMEAGMCAIDDVPGATLLLPYFEVDLTPDHHLTTLVRLHNATAEPTLFQMTTWTQWAQPTYNINFYMTGYDVVTFNLNDLFNGIVTITADRQSDPTDAISPHGQFSDWDGSFLQCNHFFPFFVNPVIRGLLLERLRAGHTGKPIAALGAGRCIGPDHGDNIGRGYVTFDVVGKCSTAFTFDLGYFNDGGVGIAVNRNALFGDWQIIDPDRALAYGGPLVSLEADSGFNATSTPTGYTFWGTLLHTPGLGSDNREPLGAVWNFPFAAGPSPSDPFTGTELIVWRDTTSAFWPDNGFNCATGPTFAPMDEAEVVCFDEQENAIEICGEGETCFPVATQKVAFDEGPLSVPFGRGFCRLDLDNPSDSPPGDRDFPPTGATVQQSYVSTLRFGAAGIGAALTATPVRHACSAPPAAAAQAEP